MKNVLCVIALMTFILAACAARLFYADRHAISNYRINLHASNIRLFIYYAFNSQCEREAG